MYKRQWKRLLLLAVLPYVSLLPFALVVGIFVAGGMYFYTSQNFIALGVLAFIGVILALFYLTVTFSVSSLAMIYQIANNTKSLTIKELLKKGWSIVWSYWVLSLLSSLLIFGGILLFVVPGIIFSIWFAFAMYILVIEGTKGMDALVKSREYVRGSWWGVFGRIALVSIIVWIIVWVFTMIFQGSDNEGIGGIMQFIISIILTPFTVIYTYLMYENLKKNKPDIANATPSASSKRLYSIIAVLGFLLMVGLLFWVTQMAIQSFSDQQQNPDIFDPEQLENVVPTNTTRTYPPLEES